MYTYVGVDYKKCPPSITFKRGRMLLGGWRITEVNGRSRVTTINICDPCRAVPKFVADGDSSVKSMQALVKLLKPSKKK